LRAPLQRIAHAELLADLLSGFRHI
jgi:hypothetical protein